MAGGFFMGVGVHRLTRGYFKFFKKFMGVGMIITKGGMV
jgi:hypothetical protein